ncbi:hypothetical protein BDZ45DRAFT_737753 [Acephala macrosclerotiorum]|nr:hypothetical protein BDZ45DRAFT_737753 [Acephala macrosclerotiorum]
MDCGQEEVFGRIKSMFKRDPRPNVSNTTTITEKSLPAMVSHNQHVGNAQNNTQPTEVYETYESARHLFITRTQTQGLVQGQWKMVVEEQREADKQEAAEIKARKLARDKQRQETMPRVQ